MRRASMMRLRFACLAVLLAAVILGCKDDRFVPHALTVLSLRGQEITDLTAFLGPVPFARFGLPATLE